MRLRALAPVVALCLLTACAPDPRGVATPEPTEESTAATQSEEPAASSLQTEASPDEEGEAVDSPAATEASPVESRSETSSVITGSPEATSASSPTAVVQPPSPGWTVLDARIATTADVDALGLPTASATYLRSRLGDDCNVQFTIFTVHSDGTLVGEESGICDGAGLYVYGAAGTTLERTVEITRAPQCSELEGAGVPDGVPNTALFPDGLACMGRGQLERY